MTPNLTPEQLAAMREAAEKATKGEWRIDAGSSWDVDMGGGLGDAECSFKADAAYIVAAQPANVLALLADRDALAERVRELERLVYVPGLWRCPKCKFQLIQGNLNARDGTVTARNEPGDKCPNCTGPLWRVSERDAGNDMIDRAEEAFEARRAAEAERDAMREALGKAAASAGFQYMTLETRREIDAALTPKQEKPDA